MVPFLGMIFKHCAPMTGLVSSISSSMGIVWITRLSSLVFFALLILNRRVLWRNKSRDFEPLFLGLQRHRRGVTEPRNRSPVFVNGMVVWGNKSRDFEPRFFGHCRWISGSSFLGALAGLATLDGLFEPCNFRWYCISLAVNVSLINPRWTISYTYQCFFYQVDLG